MLITLLIAGYLIGAAAATLLIGKAIAFGMGSED